MPSWWPSWVSDKPKNSDNKPEPAIPKQLNESLHDIPRQADDLVASLYAQAAALPPHLRIFTIFLLGGTSALAVHHVYVRYFKRIPNSGWVTPKMLAKRRWIKGYVTSVGDADNFRVYHTPGIGWRWPLKFRRIPVGRTDLKDQTIHIRIAGVDAPESGHFGRPPQPFSEESLAWLKSKVEQKFVYCQLFSKDQYGRIVAAVHLKPRLLPGWLATGKDVSLEMLRAGWAGVYEQAGGEYGRSGLAEFLRVQQAAQHAKRGMWKHGTQGETPAEYKKRHREGASSAESVVPPSQIEPAAKKSKRSNSSGWLSRILRLRSNK
ncbi:SNase-domain-containing protein [Cubamyces sp. BRFM 1775]|nr:SNase-domain-containing protein [Cubamyces sp. BRFM 1775]